MDSREPGSVSVIVAVLLAALLLVVTGAMLIPSTSRGANGCLTMGQGQAGSHSTSHSALYKAMAI